MAAGYRPADLSVEITAAGSPINAANGVDPTEPQTTLQVPSPSVVQIVRDVWWLTKRHTNVYLVVDTSGSMYGDKLERVQEALMSFIGQVKGDTERIGLIAFSSSVYYVDELDELQFNRDRLISVIGGLQADGDTAMLDAVSEAYGRLQYLQDEDRINAIVVMTDGREKQLYHWDTAVGGTDRTRKRDRRSGGDLLHRLRQRRRHLPPGTDRHCQWGPGPHRRPGDD